jgi:general secretion pathway protein D
MQQVTGGGAGLPAMASVVPAEHSNSLLCVGTPVQLQEVLRIVHELDIEAPSGKGRLNAIFLNYLSAEEAAKNLNDLLAQTLDENQQRRISIQPSVANNALLIDSTPSDFEVVRTLVRELDRIPPQVMVEILIAEIALGDAFDLGVELSTIESPRDGSTTVIGRNRPDETDALLDTISQGLFPRGLAVGVARGSFTTAEGLVVPRIPVLITALQENRDVRIISSVPLMAQNNREATVSVVENIPILRSTIEGGSGVTRDVIQNIDRIDVGVKLRFTPHVNPDNEVTMTLNPSIEAIVDRGSANIPFTPTIAKREVTTTVTVPNKETIVISGLIRDDEILEESKIPFLGDIPLLGQLFRKDSRRRQRTNLLIFVTPHIVTDREAANEMRERLEAQSNLSPAARQLGDAGPVRE